MKPKRSNLRVVIDIFNSLDIEEFRNRHIYLRAIEEKDMALRSVEMITRLFKDAKFAKWLPNSKMWTRDRYIPTFASEELLGTYWYAPNRFKSILNHYGSQLMWFRKLYPKAYGEFKKFYNSIPIGGKFGWDDIDTTGNKRFMLRVFMLVLFQRHMITFEPPDEYTVLQHINDDVTSELFLKLALLQKKGWEEWFIPLEKIEKTQNGEG